MQQHTTMSHTNKYCRINLNVSLKAEIPEGEQVFITGNLSELGDWDPAGLPLQQIAEGKFGISLNAPVKSIVECKLTRGNWKTQGIYDLKEVPPNNLVIKANSDKNVEVDILGWLDQQVLESDPVMGRIIEKEGWACKGLRYKRGVQVWLPESYDRSDDPCCVLYMHDGQNLFEPASAFAGIDWKVDETLSRLIDSGEIPPCIVVGIPNSPDRMQELNLFTPKGRAYANFVVKEIKPWVEQNFRVRKEREFNAIMGSSMGGLMSFQMLYACQHEFGLAGCISSAFQKTSGEIFRYVKKNAGLPENSRIYLDTGEYEEPIAKSYFEMMGLLKKNGFTEGRNLMGYFDEKATHCEAAWARRLSLPLKFLFSNKII